MVYLILSEKNLRKEISQMNVMSGVSFDIIYMLIFIVVAPGYTSINKK